MAKQKSKRSEDLPKINFNGWMNPNTKWKQWVERLTDKNSKIWEKSGISEAIKASKYTIKRDESVIVGLAEKWVPSINAFEFDFGTATITLEDLMGLGGYSVFGEPVTISVSGELLEIQEKMITKHKWFTSHTSHKKASFSPWMDHFSCCEDEVIEHVGFLAMWLSRYVFPASGSVSRYVFSIAVHLAHGTRIALAPAVLASIYRDLRTLSDYVLGSSGLRLFPCTVWGPMQLLQLWAWERFWILGPCEANANYKAKNGDPLVAKWEGLKSKKRTLEDVRLVVKSEVNFQWRCFGFSVESEMFGFDLVGIDCVEKYFPSRARKQCGILRVNKSVQQKPVLTCDDDESSSFSVQYQSQTSAPSSESEAPVVKVSDEHFLSVEDEGGEELEFRVSKLEREIAGIKARLKAALAMKKRTW
ncbi:hypothetical protein Sjap_015024 [Stephania japonica]|uniref:Aminotransferase-like plant mobile domain-containing protein n=1 Tax=Stephania japonica TaxID=461633 RepID=A0AAP0NQG5_9MAGN